MIFTVNVEDWSQSVLNRSNPISRRVWDNTLTLLDLLATHDTKATFFVQGQVAKTYPILVERIHRQGHEVASQAFTHKPIYSMTPNAFDRELEHSVKILQDTTGESIMGFRAPNFSIRPDMLNWYCELLYKHGFKYDSSLFQTNNQYIDDPFSRDKFEKYNIDPFYLSHINLLGSPFSYFGGRNFRLYPYWFNRLLSQQLPDNGVFYIRPYDLDTSEYNDIKATHNIPFKYKFTQFARRRSIEPKLHWLLNKHEFTSFKQHYYHGHSKKAHLFQRLNANPQVSRTLHI